MFLGVHIPNNRETSWFCTIIKLFSFCTGSIWHVLPLSILSICHFSIANKYFLMSVCFLFRTSFISIKSPWRMLKMHIRDEVIYNYFNDCYWRGLHFFWLNKSVPFWRLWSNFIHLFFLPDNLGDVSSTENWDQFYQGFCISVWKYLGSRWKAKENFWFIDLQFARLEVQ